MSNLVKCPTCQKDVSINAPTCMHCGEQLLAPGTLKDLFYYIVMFGFGVFVFSIFFRLCVFIFREYLGMYDGSVSLSILCSIFLTLGLFNFLAEKYAEWKNK